MPPPRAPSARAVHAAPRSESVGVPSASAAASVPSVSSDKPYCRPMKGESIVSGRPDTTQCAAILPLTHPAIGCGASVICSSEPSA